VLSGYLEKFEDLQQRFDRLRDVFDLTVKRAKQQELESLSSQEGFWDDPAGAQALMQELGTLTQDIKAFQDLNDEMNDLADFVALDDDSLQGEISVKLDELQNKISQLERASFFSGKYAQKNAILSIHAGTGGVDAMDWAQMLQRMYLRFADSKSWKAEVLSTSYGEEAGIKSTDIQITGQLVYGHLQAEHGVHRLVRLSPFNAKHSRETSFALVEIMPLVEHDLDIEIKDEDLKIDVFRAGGHGGQSVNTTDSAVRITHIPTGLVAQCQNERSQLQNKQKALQVLISRLILRQEVQNKAELDKTKGEYKQGSWGNQIRSYVLQPYTMVKDHRTQFEKGDVNAVLDGDLEEFILAWLETNTCQL